MSLLTSTEEEIVSLTCPVAVPCVAGDGFQQKLMKRHLVLGVVLKWNSAMSHSKT